MIGCISNSSHIRMKHKPGKICLFHKCWCYYCLHSEGMRKVLFSQMSVCSRGGYPIQLNKGVPSSQDRGYPHLRIPIPGWGISHLRMGVPPSEDGGYPIQPDGGYPSQDSYPPPQQAGLGTPQETVQHSEYLLRSGRYASCVHAGLSCVTLS